jgi:arylsulfatase A-like enzyme
VTRTRTLLLLGAVGVLALAAAGLWALRPAPGPRLVILYATCTLNRNFLSPYNSTVRYTPNLNRFAQAAQVFTRHHTEEGQSGIAYASLLTGNQAMRHGIYYHPQKLDDSLYLMSEAFRDAGYEPFYWANHQMASPSLNYAQGIPETNVFGVGEFSVPPDKEFFLKADDPTFQRILARLREDPSYRAFVMTAFSITHGWYFHTTVGPFCASYPMQCQGLTRADLDRYGKLYRDNVLAMQYDFDATVARLGLSPADVAKLERVLSLFYKANVSHLDRRFGELIQAIADAGLLDQTLIVFTADHGEIMERRTESMRWTHGFVLSPEDIVVPLLVHAPGVAPGRFEGVTRSIDVLPTLAGLAGIDLPADSVMGVDLSPALRGEVPPPHLVAYSHSSLLPDGWDAHTHRAALDRFRNRDPAQMWVAVRDGDLVYKLSADDGAGFAPHVYDWATDPGEAKDLYDASDPQQAAVFKSLKEYKAHLVEGYRYWEALGTGVIPTERQREIMRSLGYIQ